MRAKVVSVRWIEVDQKGMKRVARCIKYKLCCACLKPLGDARVVRGCHEKCARATYRAIERGELSDSDQVEAGEWLPHGQRGPKPTNPVTIKARSAS
jgi:hypothetical protein